MAYISPGTSVTLIKNCHLDKGYNHTYYFSTLSDQTAFFNTSSNFDGYLSFSNFTFQRQNKGTMRVEIPTNSNYNYSKFFGFNYMFFTNPSDYGTKRFYAFINDITYVNNVTIEINYSIDVMQTWYFDYTLEHCFVEREHSLTDNIGDNLIPEPLSVGDYVVNSKTDILYSLKSSGLYDFYLTFLYAPNIHVVTPTYYYPYYDIDIIKLDHLYAIGDSGVSLHTQCKAYQKSGEYTNFVNNNIPVGYQSITLHIQETNVLSLYNEYSTIITDMVQGITKLSHGENSLLAMICIPSRALNKNAMTWETLTCAYSKDSFSGNVSIEYSISTPVYLTENVDINQYPNFSFNGITYNNVKNNKLYTSPYSKVVINNRGGQSMVCEWEKSSLNRTDSLSYLKQLRLSIESVVSPKVEICLLPMYYNNEFIYYNMSLYLPDLPTGSWNVDSYTSWVSQNGSAWSLKMVTNSIVGLANVFTSTSARQSFNSVGKLVGGLSDSIGSIIQAQNKGDIYGGGMPSSLYGWVRNVIGFTVEQQTITPDKAKMIDDYFTMFGYAVKEVKVPNIFAKPWNKLRPYWNYIKTNGCIIHGKTTNASVAGGLPAGEEEKISAIYDKGITFWKANTSSGYNGIGDYSATNSPQPQ